MSASFPVLERFTDHLGKWRKGLVLMLCALVPSAPALAAKDAKKEKATPRSGSRAGSALKSECKDGSVECWNSLAVSLARQGRLEEARQALEEAFQADARLNTLRGNLEKLYGNLASQAYDSALGLPQEKKNPVDLALLPEATVRPRPERTAQAVPAKPTPAPVREAVAPKPSKPTHPAVVAAVSTPVSVPAAPVVAAPVEVKPVVPAAVVAKPQPSKPAPVSAPVPVSTPVPVAKPVEAPVPPVRSETSSVMPRIPKPLLLASAVRKDSAKAIVAVPAKPVPVAKPQSRPIEPAARVAVPQAKPTVRQPLPKDAVRKALEAWAAHWSSKDVDGYLSWYAPDFKPASGAERAAWETLRRERITAPASIDVKLEAVRLESDDSGRVVSHFLQLYKTDKAQLRSRKRLVWARVDTAWKIVSEGEAK